MILLNATTELDLSELVPPLAFTCGLEMPPEMILDGVTRDGSRLKFNALALRTVLRVRTGICADLEALLVDWITHPAVGCTNKRRCLDSLVAAKAWLIPPHWSARYHLPPWSSTTSVLAPPSVEVGGAYEDETLAQRMALCVECTVHFQRNYTEIRQDIWSSVPGWVGAERHNS
jgi:hypothetical protein